MPQQPQYYDPNRSAKREPYDRTIHCWYRLDSVFDWKCLLCGATTKTPTENDAAKRYERLTNAERVLVAADIK